MTEYPMMHRRAITVLTAGSATEMVRHLSRHTGARPGQFEIRVRRGGRAGNSTFLALREELSDAEAAIVSIPSLGAPTHWAALSGNRCAVVAAGPEGTA